MSDNPQPNNKQQIKLHIPQDLQATYANLLVMSFTRNEFILDFAQLLPPTTRANVQARVITAPQHAKAMMYLLQRNIERYEAQHGTIEMPKNVSLADQLFKGIAPDVEDEDNDDDS
jgi:hypothetical protein